MHNYAFIDAQNVHRGTTSLGWRLDWYKFRIYLKEKYSVTKAYLFIGYLPEKEKLYIKLRKAGYIIIFKPVIIDPDGMVKGNCDADLVLHTILKLNDYEGAVLASSDGDFYSLVHHLYRTKKLVTVLSPYVKKRCSRLLKQEAREKIAFMNNLQQKIEKK